MFIFLQDCALIKRSVPFNNSCVCFECHRPFFLQTSCFQYSIYLRFNSVYTHPQYSSARNRNTQSLDSRSNKQFLFFKWYNAPSSSFRRNPWWLSKTTLHEVLMAFILSPFQIKRFPPFPTTSPSCTLFSSHKQCLRRVETIHSTIIHNCTTPLFISDTYGKHAHNSQLETTTLLLSK